MSEPLKRIYALKLARTCEGMLAGCIMGKNYENLRTKNITLDSVMVLTSAVGFLFIKTCPNHPLTVAHGANGRNPLQTALKLIIS